MSIIENGRVPFVATKSLRKIRARIANKMRRHLLALPLIAALLGACNPAAADPAPEFLNRQLCLFWGGACHPYKLTVAELSKSCGARSSTKWEDTTEESAQLRCSGTDQLTKQVVDVVFRIESNNSTNPLASVTGMTVNGTVASARDIAGVLANTAANMATLAQQVERPETGLVVSDKVLNQPIFVAGKNGADENSGVTIRQLVQSCSADHHNGQTKFFNGPNGVLNYLCSWDLVKMGQHFELLFQFNPTDRNDSSFKVGLMRQYFQADKWDFQSKDILTFFNNLREGIEAANSPSEAGKPLRACRTINDTHCRPPE